MADIKKIEQELTEMVNNYKPLDRRKKALEEIEKIKKAGIDIPNIEAIVKDYPDFNHVNIRCRQPNFFQINFCFATEELKKDPKFITAAAKIMEMFIDEGAKRENE